MTLLCNVVHEHRAKRLCPKEFTVEVGDRREMKIDAMWVNTKKLPEGKIHSQTSFTS